MKKCIKYFSFLFFCFLTLLLNVEALGSCKCQYGDKIIVTASDSGVSVQKIVDGIYKTVESSDFILLIDSFRNYSTKKWQCPNKIYYTLEFGNVTFNPKMINLQSGQINLELNTSKSSDGEAFESVLENKTRCFYKGYEITFNHNNKTVTMSNPTFVNCNTINKPNYSSVSVPTTCPSIVYLVVSDTSGSTTCTYTFDKPSSGDYYELTAGKVNLGNGKDTQSHSNCPLGEHVTKDLYGILNILKIVAPILCFAMSVYDLIVSLTKDAEVESKKVAKRFGKRLIYVALLFFVPVLVDALMQYLNVWNENGTCSLAEGVKSSEQSDYSCYKCGNEYMWKTNSSAKKVCGEGKVLTELPLINQQSCNGSANVKACYVCRSTNNSYFGTLKDAYNNLRCDPRGLSNEDTNKCN